MRPRVGLIVNPIAGMGGRVGLKGTDGSDTLELARSLGAEPVAEARTLRTLTRLKPCRDRVTLVVAAGAMGESAAARCGFPLVALKAGGSEGTSAADTKAAAQLLRQEGVSLILFAGGDGTCRDIVGEVKLAIPVLGIPTGVKMHSGVFATSPEAAADTLIDTICTGGPIEVRDAEVMDVDEEEARAGRLSARLYAYAHVPWDRIRIQNPKAAARSGDGDLAALCALLGVEAKRDRLTLLGPGSTTKRILEAIGEEGTLLGVDAVRGGHVIGRDLSEDQILDMLSAEPSSHLIVTVIGGQGFVFGRGNQQLSPTVLRRIGFENVTIVASLDKIVGLQPPALHIDTGDPELDRQFGRFRRVRVGATRTVVVRVAA